MIALPLIDFNNIGLGDSGQGADGIAETTLLLFGDSSIISVTPQSGEVERRRLAELGKGDPPFRMVRRAGPDGEALVFFGDRGNTYVMDAHLYGTPRLLGPSSLFIPSAESDRVWLVTNGGEESVVEVAVSGTITNGPLSLPPERTLVGEVMDGLVLASNQEPAGFEIWSPSEQAVIYRSERGFPIAVGRNIIASCEETAAPNCGKLQIGRRFGESPEEISTDLPEGVQLIAAALSPDESLLAVIGREQEGRFTLHIIDADNGELEGHSSFVSDPTNSDLLLWSRDGDNVYIVDDKQLLIYAPASAETRVLPVAAGPVYGGASVRG